MIKVDIVSGFLGVGKTTLIKLLAKALADGGERIVIIENEFGEIGIDGHALQIVGLEVFEITNGCLCCSLKGDFVNTLLKIADEIHPDRILVEPSGVFVPADVMDIFNEPKISEKMAVNSLTTIIDSLHYLKQRVKYRFFFENQIRFARQVVMSKTETLSAESLQLIKTEILKINREIPIHIKPWAEMVLDDFARIVSPDLSPNTSCSGILVTDYKANGQSDSHSSIKKPSSAKPRIPSMAGAFKVQTSVQKKHAGFQSFSIVPRHIFTRDSLHAVLVDLTSTSYGEIIRAKGFVPAESGVLEFQLVDRTIEITGHMDSILPTVYILGENLDKDALEKLF